MSTLSELRMTQKPLSTGATAVYPWSATLQERFRFKSRFGDEVLLFQMHDGKTIHLPRALCPTGEIDERVQGELVSFPKSPTPRPHQVELFGETSAFIQAGLSGVVCAYTGYGKTVLGYHAAAVLNRKTLVITTKDDIYQQWINGACGGEGSPNFLGLTRDQVGEIRGKKVKVAGCPFVVGMIHTLCREGKITPEIAAQFGLVIFDECHRAPAEQFSHVLAMFPALIRLGLSATPGRSDGKDLLWKAHIGPIRAKTEAQLMVPKVLRFTSDWKCPRVYRMSEETGEKELVILPHDAGKTTHIEQAMAADPERNKMLASLCKDALDKGRKTVVFSTVHTHLEALYLACNREFGVPADSMGFYVHAATKAEKAQRELEKVKPLVFTTYGMMGEGTSLDWLDTCILAIPRAQVAQPVGRIRREYPDKKLPVVMDVVDKDSPVFAGYANSRARWYREIGCVVKDF